jgi:hypothetical protein
MNIPAGMTAVPIAALQTGSAATKMNCHHAWTYRNGHSECIRCKATALDGRGLPHGHYAINGAAMNASRLVMSFVCPVCLSDINPRVIDGELRVLCAGPEGHDVAELGRAMTKEQRDYIRQKQEQDFYTILEGLPQELKEVVQCVRSKV